MVNPYKNSESGKKVQVEEMFDQIAPKYDFLNHFLSLGIDKLWRRKAIRILKPFQPKKILDIATGTGDLAIAALRLKPDKVIGIDISEGMLRKGREKLKKKRLLDKIELIQGDSEEIPFEDVSFDALMVAFGVRNFENLQKGLNEMFRVLKPGGLLLFLNFHNQHFSLSSRSIIFIFLRFFLKSEKLSRRMGLPTLICRSQLRLSPTEMNFSAALGMLVFQNFLSND